MTTEDSNSDLLLLSDSNFSLFHTVVDFEAQMEGDTDDLPPKSSFYYLSNLFLALICALTAIGVAFLTYKVVKMGWRADKVIPVMLVFLDLSLLGKYLCFKVLQDR